MPAVHEQELKKKLEEIWQSGGAAREALSEELRKVVEVAVDTGIVTSATNTTLTDKTKNWPTDQWKDYVVEIVSGTGEGQIRKIVSNTSDTLTVDPAWVTVPDATSRYAIRFVGVGVMSLSAWGGTALTGRDVSLDLAKLQNLDAALSTRASESTLSTLNSKIPSDPAREGGNLATIASRLNVNLDTRASEATLSGIKAKTDNLDVLLSTRASETTLSGIKTQTDKLTFDASGFLRTALASDEIGLAKESTLSSELTRLAKLRIYDDTLATPDWTDLTRTILRESKIIEDAVGLLKTSELDLDANKRLGVRLEIDNVGLAKSSDISATQPRDVTDRAARVLGQITDGTSAVNPADFGSNTHPRNITQISGTALTGRDWSGDFAKLQNIDILLSALRDALLAGESVEAHSTGLDETVAQEITLDTKGHKLLEVYAKAAAATTFRLDVSPDNTTWITDYTIWSSVTEIKETLWNGFRYVKLKSDAAGASGDKVDLFLAAK